MVFKKPFGSCHRAPHVLGREWFSRNQLGCHRAPHVLGRKWFSRNHLGPATGHPAVFCNKARMRFSPVLHGVHVSEPFA